MQLFVLGPAFGLPSIDAECNAAVALLRSRDSADWQLIPTYDDHERLPLLVDGADRIAGFNNISRHLSHIEPALGTQQRADALAISSFLESNAQTLLDISLYVSFENYSTTRSAFTKILSWHANYILPPKRRAAARLRTEHLGISSMDVDNVHEDLSNKPAGFDGVGKEQGFEVEAQKRASLLLPRKDTVRSLLQRPEHAAIFKLHALADNFFEPLQDLLGEKDYLLGTDLDDVDCLAYGYLSLMLYPKLPQDWLASTMRRKYKKLVAYTERMHRKLRLHTNAEDVMSLAKSETERDLNGRSKAYNLTLPWRQAAVASVTDVVRSTVRELLSHIPFIKSSATITTARPSASSGMWAYLPAVLGITATSVCFGMYFSFRNGVLIWPHGEHVHIFGRKRFSDYGHLGAALAGVSLLGQQASRDSALHAQEDSEKAVIVDVAVEGDIPP